MSAAVDTDAVTDAGGVIDPNNIAPTDSGLGDTLKSHLHAIVVTLAALILLPVVAIAK